MSQLKKLITDGPVSLVDMDFHNLAAAVPAPVVAAIKEVSVIATTIEGDIIHLPFLIPAGVTAVVDDIADALQAAVTFLTPAVPASTPDAGAHLTDSTPAA